VFQMKKVLINLSLITYKLMPQDGTVAFSLGQWVDYSLVKALNSEAR